MGGAANPYGKDAPFGGTEGDPLKDFSYPTPATEPQTVNQFPQNLTYLFQLNRYLHQFINRLIKCARF